MCDPGQRRTRERDLGVDLDGFDVEMEAQRARARASSQFSAVDSVLPNPGQSGIQPVFLVHVFV